MEQGARRVKVEKGGGGEGHSERLYLGGNHFRVTAESVLRELSQLEERRGR